MATDWRLVRLGSRAVSGAGVLVLDPTAVEPRGRIGPQDPGLGNDSQADALLSARQSLRDP